MEYEKPISYLEFKLNKELAYQDTFEKDDKIRKEYEEYLERLNEQKKWYQQLKKRKMKRKPKKTVSGYYYDGKKMTILYEQKR